MKKSYKIGLTTLFLFLITVPIVLACFTDNTEAQDERIIVDSGVITRKFIYTIGDSTRTGFAIELNNNSEYPISESEYSQANIGDEVNVYYHGFNTFGYSNYYDLEGF